MFGAIISFDTAYRLVIEKDSVFRCKYSAERLSCVMRIASKCIRKFRLSMLFVVASETRSRHNVSACIVAVPGRYFGVTSVEDSCPSRMLASNFVIKASENIQHL